MLVIVTEKDILEILRNAGGAAGDYKSHEVIRMSDKPIGYLADHFVLNVQTTNGSREFFLKAVPHLVEKRVEYLEETGFFSKEVKFYETLVPLLQSYSSLSWAPECYLVKDGKFIVLEILRKYKVVASKDLVMDFEHMKIATAALAVFHASSVIFEEKTGKEISESFWEILEENAYPMAEGHVRQKGLENAIELLMELVKLIPKYQDPKKQKQIQQSFPETVRKIYKFAQTSTKYRNVVSHGDLWLNNIMFEYADKDEPVSCKIIDFQLARFAPPAFDLAQLVYINTSKEMRVNHLDDIFRVYCDTFEMELKKSGLKAVNLPREEINESFKEFHLAGLIEAAVFGHLTLLPPTLSTSIMSSSEEYDKFINQSRVETCLEAFKEFYYRERLTEILSEIIDEFILKN